MRPAYALLLSSTTHACTMYGVGRLASADGTTLVSHSEDSGPNPDVRLSYVPPATHSPGAMRSVYTVEPSQGAFPKFIGSALGETFLPLPGQKPTAEIGRIPQVAFTHGYYVDSYATQNDCDLSFGESTASAVFRADPVGLPGGTSLFSINELSNIAAERVCSAREAVSLMGALAEKHGFYGADGGAGEMLMVGDPREVWMFHILSDPTAKSAIWVAQRVPDDEVAVAANHFMIREVDLDDPDFFLGSRNMSAIALAHGLWDGQGKLDFTNAFSLGEYGNKYYSGRRVWDGYRRFKPSHHLPATYESKAGPWSGLQESRPYPFSLKPDAPLSVQDLFAAHRSHYEGTPYDMTKGAAAGPFGSPDRYAPGKVVKGAWERSVAIYRASFTWVVQAGGGACGCTGRIWLGMADPSTTVFAPLSVCTGAAPPEMYTRGGPGKVDRKSIYWAHRYTQNLAQIRYSAMIVDIQAHAERWEEQGVKLVSALRCQTGRALKKALDGLSGDILASSWALTDELMGKFADGAEAVPKPMDATGATVAARSLGYTAEWLADVRFADGPEKIAGHMAHEAGPGWLERQRREAGDDLALALAREATRAAAAVPTALLAKPSGPGPGEQPVAAWIAAAGVALAALAALAVVQIARAWRRASSAHARPLAPARDESSYVGLAAHA